MYNVVAVDKDSILIREIGEGLLPILKQTLSVSGDTWTEPELNS